MSVEFHICVKSVKNIYLSIFILSSIVYINVKKAESGEWSVLTLGSLCLPAAVCGIQREAEKKDNMQSVTLSTVQR